MPANSPITCCSPIAVSPARPKKTSLTTFPASAVSRRLKFTYAVSGRQVTNEIDEEIASLNSRRYTLTANRKKIVKSLDEGTIRFDPDEAQALFNEAGVHLDGQIKRDFQQLIEFSKAITEERRTYLREDLAEIEGD